MQVIRETIRFNDTVSGNSINLNFTLSSDDNLMEYQEEIDNLTQFTTLDLVNPPIDGEKRRFKFYDGTTPTINLKFLFYSTTLSTYVDTFFAAGFTPEEIIGSKANILNSFFILDFYDTFDVFSQTKIFTTYFTKVLQPPMVLYGLNMVYKPNYSIGANYDNQLYYWHVPLSYVNTFTGTTAIGYTKISFLNAKTGKLTLFYNLDNESGDISNTPEKMFFKTKLNLVNSTWNFITTSYPTITAKELRPIENPAVTNRANDTVATVNDIQQNPPTGSTFSYSTGTGTYIT